MPTPKSRLKNKLKPETTVDGFNDALITPPHVAHLLGVSVRTEQSMFANGEGPPCIKIARKRYSTKDAVEAWIAAQMHAATEEALANFGRHNRPSTWRKRRHT